jgi:hypothetical protein
VSARERLAALEADPTLRCTGARWRAHEKVFPGMGADVMVARYAGRDRATLGAVERCLAEFRERVPEDAGSIGYLVWLVEELAA